MIEHATGDAARSEAVEDLRAIQAARARGELRGVRHVRVVRDAAGRRRVIAADPRPTVRTAADRARRLAALDRELSLRDVDAEVVEVKRARAAMRAASRVPFALVEMFRRAPVTHAQLAVVNEAAVRRMLR